MKYINTTVVDPKHFDRSVTLRVTPSRNGQARRIWLASEFSSVPV
jgi:hypothetical protein